MAYFKMPVMVVDANGVYFYVASCFGEACVFCRAVCFSERKLLHGVPASAQFALALLFSLEDSTSSHSRTSSSSELPRPPSLTPSGGSN